MASLRRKMIAGLPLILAASVVLGGCETAFEPFNANELHFSIFGYLDASADTQFVRITSLRDSIFTAPTPLDAVVVVEDLASGRKTTWRDSLFQFSNNRLAHNFWSTEPIAPGATYRMTVTRSDGAASTATATVPDTFLAPVLDTGISIPQPNPPSQTISVEGIDQLADLQIRYVLRVDPGSPPSARSISYFARATRFANGRLAVTGNLYEDVRSGNNCPLAVEAEVFVAAAGPGWPDVLALDDEALARPDVIGNVENGVGLLGGVVTQTVGLPGLVGLFNSKQRFCERGCLSFPPGC